MTPLALMFGREMRTKLSMLSNDCKGPAEEARDSDFQYMQKIKEYAHRGAKESSIGTGNTVLLRREVRGK